MKYRLARESTSTYKTDLHPISINGGRSLLLSLLFLKGKEDITLSLFPSLPLPLVASPLVGSQSKSLRLYIVIPLLCLLATIHILMMGSLKAILMM